MHYKYQTYRSNFFFSNDISGSVGILSLFLSILSYYWILCAFHSVDATNLDLHFNCQVNERAYACACLCAHSWAHCINMRKIDGFDFNFLVFSLCVISELCELSVSPNRIRSHRQPVHIHNILIFFYSQNWFYCRFFFLFFFLYGCFLSFSLVSHCVCCNGARSLYREYRLWRRCCIAFFMWNLHAHAHTYTSVPVPISSVFASNLELAQVRIDGTHVPAVPGWLAGTCFEYTWEFRSF